MSSTGRQAGENVSRDLTRAMAEIGQVGQATGLKGTVHPWRECQWIKLETRESKVSLSTKIAKYMNRLMLTLVS